MAGATQIGTGAVVLTANADKLLAGLDKARAATDHWASRTAKSANKAAHASGGGGLLGGILSGAGGGLSKVLSGALGGAAAGGAAAGAFAAVGAAVAGVGAALELVSAFASKVVDKLSNIREIAAGYGNLSKGQHETVDRVGAATDRMQASADELLFTFAAGVLPIIERLAPVFERSAFVMGEVFTAVADGVGRLLTGIAELIDDVTGWGLAGQSAGDLYFQAFRLAAVGAGYMADAVTVASGAVLYGVGHVVKVLAEVPRAMQSAVEAAVRLNNKLPDSLRMDWLSDYAGGLGAMADLSDKAGQAAIEMGGKMSQSWGTYAADMGKWADEVIKKFGETERLTKSTGAAMAGAFGQGTTEAYSVLAKFQTGNLLTGQSAADNPVKIAQAQLKELKGNTRLLVKIADKIGAGVLKVIP